jgi:hypothetical protein
MITEEEYETLSFPDRVRYHLNNPLTIPTALAAQHLGVLNEFVDELNKALSQLRCMLQFSYDKEACYTFCRVILRDSDKNEELLFVVRPSLFSRCCFELPETWYKGLHTNSQPCFHVKFCRNVEDLRTAIETLLDSEKFIKTVGPYLEKRSP